MKLTIEGIQDRESWKQAGIQLPSYNIKDIVHNTKEAPIWVHFGAGNIFRIFIGSAVDLLIEKGEIQKGLTCIETYDEEIIEKIYKPFDNLALAVTLNSDGSTDKRVIGSLSEALSMHSLDRIKDIFVSPSLQIVSLTITEKGYALKDVNGNYFKYIQSDIENGPQNCKSTIAVLCKLLNERYKAHLPIAIVSMDNCSHNGEKLQNAVITIAREWKQRNYVDQEFIEYLSNEELVSFPWTMIDKITPRPCDSVYKQLKEMGIENMNPIITNKNTYIAPFINAEKPEYLVIEDNFPNGRPALEKAGIYMSDRDTVNKVERMKVTTCLNPLHTALAVYGCTLGYTLIADEMKDEQLVQLVHQIGPIEGMKVVSDLDILSPADFVNEVIQVRLPNPFMPDTPQRIATDTSQKVGIRYGETIKEYVNKYGNARELIGIPLAIAGWCRYLLAVNDDGEEFELSSDLMLLELTELLKDIKIGELDTYHGQLKPILSNERIFHIDLYKAEIGELIEQIFIEEISGKGAIRKTLKKYLKNEESS